MESISLSKAGSTLGGILLITGCSIGGGMIGFPLVSLATGFIPSSLVLVVCCLFMTSTALLILEAILLFEKGVNLISLAKKTLGPIGAQLTWVSFLFIFYCLMVAYLCASTDLIGAFFSVSSDVLTRLLIAFCVGLCIILGTKRVDFINLLLMLGLVCSYLLLVATGLCYIKPSNFIQMNWSSATPCIPIMLIAFGYHNLVPTVATYLQRNIKALRIAIIVGGAIPLLFYLVWQSVILGILPQNAQDSLEVTAQASAFVMALLHQTSNSAYVGLFTQIFVCCAIFTSFISNALSCIDFLVDGFSLKKNLKNRMLMSLLVLIPPLVVSFSFSHLFLKALEYAGGFATAILFGALPALIVWRGRYVNGYKGKQLLPGGKVVLAAIIVMALGVVCLEINQQLKLM